MHAHTHTHTHTHKHTCRAFFLALYFISSAKFSERGVSLFVAVLCSSMMTVENSSTRTQSITQSPSYKKKKKKM